MNSPMRFSLVLLALAGNILLFSCTRAVDNEKVSVKIALPKSQSSNKWFSSSIMALPTAEPAETALPSATNEFPPEPEDASEYETNCYLVAVSYPDAASNENYCGTKSTVAGETIDDVIISSEFSFSQNFVGLVGPETTEIELADVLIGPNRTLTVIAVPTTDASTCKSLLTQPFTKTSMLRPRKVGSVTQDIRVNGDPISISINQSTPVLYDDCIITDTKLNYPDAEKIIVEQDNFPFNFLRGFINESNGFVCQPVIIGLRAGVLNQDREAQAALNFPSEATLKKTVSSVTTTVTTFNSHANCLGNNGHLTFEFPRNQPLKKRWMRVTETLSTTMDLTAYLTAPQPALTSVASTFNVGKNLTYILDHNIPKVLQLDTCYKVSASVRNLSGSAAAVSQNVDLTYDGTAGLKFYSSSTGCQADTYFSSPLPSATINIYSGTAGTEYYVKAFSNPLSAGQLINFHAKHSSAPTGSKDLPFLPSIKIYTSVETQSQLLSASGNSTLQIDNIGAAVGYPKLAIPNDGGCYPVAIYINNRLGATLSKILGLTFNFYLKDGSSASFESVPLRYQVVDLTRDGSSSGGYTVRYGVPITDTTGCASSNLMAPISANSVPITGTALFPSNGTYYTLFIKTNGGTTTNDLGRRRLQLYYGGTSDTTTIGYPVGQIDFELTRPELPVVM